MYYIYAYIDPNTDLPFYIGKGRGDRKFKHLRETIETTDNVDKHLKIRNLCAAGNEPRIVELESDIDDERLAYNREEYYILRYGRKGIDSGGILANKVLRGEPPTPVWDEQRKQAHSDFNKAYWTAERRAEHSKHPRWDFKQTSGTVSVTDVDGNSSRIPKTEYDSMDKTGPIHTWAYVPVSHKESKNRKNKQLPLP